MHSVWLADASALADVCWLCGHLALPAGLVNSCGQHSHGVAKEVCFYLRVCSSLFHCCGFTGEHDAGLLNLGVVLC